MNYQILGMIVGFLTIVFTILNQGHQLRAEMNQKLDKVENRLLAEIEKVEDRLLAENKATNAKLDTFLLALFKGNVQLPKQNDKDAA